MQPSKISSAVRIYTELVQDAGRVIDPFTDSVHDRLGLLMDFLVHEVIMSALFGHSGRPVDRNDAIRGRNDRVRVMIEKLNPLRRQGAQLPVLHEYNASCIGQYRGNIGGEEEFAVSDPEDEGTAVPDRDKHVRAFFAQNAKGIGPP